MPCTTATTDILRFADAELAPEHAAALEQHIATCADCAFALADVMMLKRAVRLAGQRFVPSAELRRDVRANISNRGWLTELKAWPAALAIAALILLVSAVAVRMMTNRAVSEQLLAGVIDRHIAALASANPVDVVSTDRHTVKPWFQGRLPFSFDLPELTGTDFTLQGGRVAYLDGSPGAQLIYGLRKHEISVFIFQDRNAFERLYEGSTSERSYVVESWKHAGLRYVAVADVPPSDAKTLVQMFKNAAPR